MKNRHRLYLSVIAIMAQIVDCPRAEGMHMMIRGGGIMTFSDLKLKDVINICDGRRLGRPFDIVLNEHACIEALLVPSQGGLLSMFKGERDGLAISWSRVRRIGDDVILVELDPHEV